MLAHARSISLSLSISLSFVPSPLTRFPTIGYSQLR